MTCVTNRPPNSAITARIPTSEAIITSPVARVRRRPRATSQRIGGSIARARNHEITTMKMTLPSRDSARHVASPRKTANPVISSARGSHAGGLRGSRAAYADRARRRAVRHRCPPCGQASGLAGGVRLGWHGTRRRRRATVTRAEPVRACLSRSEQRDCHARQVATCPTCREGTSWSRTSRRPASRARTGAKPPAGAPDPLVGTPATGRRGGDPGHRVALRDAGRGGPGRHRAVGRRAAADERDQNDTAEIPTGSPHDTAEIPTSIDVEVPASSPTEDRAVLLARLQLLETENARLRATATVPPPAAPVAPRPRRKVGRSTAAVVLILIGALLAPIAVVGSWARGLVVDTDRYVDTVAPIAEDPLVQSAVANRITHRGRGRAERRGADHAGDGRRGRAGPAAAGRPGGHLVAGAAAGGDHRVHPQERHQDRQLGRVRERLGGGQPGRARADRRDAARRPRRARADQRHAAPSRSTSPRSSSRSRPRWSRPASRW